MIRVWSDRQEAGVLDRHGARGSTFAYVPAADPLRAVSVTMPVRVKSWDAPFGLLPIFEMNLPEGALRERLLRRFAKATGRFDDLDLLGIVGRSQIGRLRYSGLREEFSEEVPFQSIDEILTARRGGELFTYLLDRYAVHSGLSGIQPKVLIRATGDKLSDTKLRQSPSVLSATHIVKMWEADEYPELAANERFCLEAASAAGLPVPPFQMSEDGGALIIERFDLVEGTYMGFEDFCVLNGLGTADKYNGSYEARLFKRARDYLAPNDLVQSLEQLFALFVMNCALRNGDAHLKNFGILYSSVAGPVRLAPVYDLITTWAYLPQDPMALTLDGSTRWPERKRLIDLGHLRCGLSHKRCSQILERTADALATVRPRVEDYFRQSAPEIGARMLAAWDDGIKRSLELSGRVSVVPKAPGDESRLSRSEALLISHLERHGGVLDEPIRAIAEAIGLAPSTVSAALQRLSVRGVVTRDRKQIRLSGTSEA